MEIIGFAGSKLMEFGLDMLFSKSVSKVKDLTVMKKGCLHVADVLKDHAKKTRNHPDNIEVVLSRRNITALANAACNYIQGSDDYLVESEKYLDNLLKSYDVPVEYSKNIKRNFLSVIKDTCRIKHEEVYNMQKDKRLEKKIEETKKQFDRKVTGLSTRVDMIEAKYSCKEGFNLSTLRDKLGLFEKKSEKIDKLAKEKLIGRKF